MQANEISKPGSKSQPAMKGSKHLGFVRDFLYSRFIPRLLTSPHVLHSVYYPRT